MSKGLKQLLKLEEPRKLDGVSGAEVTAFKAAIKAVGKSLAYTAVHGVQEDHDRLVDRRDKAVSAYHRVIKKAGAAKPSANAAAFKRVSQSASSLRKDAQTLRDRAAKHLAAWSESEEAFDTAAEQATEMVDWGYADSERFVQVVDVIRERVNLRRYKEAVEALKKLLDKLQPAYHDYVLQRDAKVDYEKLREDNRETLDAFAASNHELLAEWRSEIQGNLDSIAISAEALDYATALTGLEAELPVIEEYLEEFAYEDALSRLQPKLDRLRSEESLGTIQGAASMSIIWLAEKLMQQLATSGDYQQALVHLKKLEPQVDAELQNRDRVKLEAAKEEHRTTLSNAYLTDTRGDEPLKQMKSGYVDLRKAMDDLAANGKWSEALAQFPATLAAAEELLEQDTAYGKLKKLRSGSASDDQWLDSFGRNVPPDPIWNEELLLYRQYRTNLASGDYLTALEQWKSLRDIRADLEIRVNASDAEAGPKAAAVADKVRSMAGARDLTKLNQAGKEKLVKKLERLPQKKLRQMWKDLLMPSSPLGPQEQVIQAALFDAMKLDREFTQAEAKLREAYEAKLAGDPELQQAIADWDSVDPRNNPLVDEATKKAMIQRALTEQSSAYGIDVPEINWDTGYAWGQAEFSADTNQITINPDSLNGAVGHTHADEDAKFMPGSNAIGLMLHENAHNFQDELAKKYLRGDLAADDPLYEQAELFSFNYDDGYLELAAGGDEHHFGDYAQQPSERHSYEVQESATEALLAADPPA
ncbi:MAG: hypothetical protein AAGJ46_02830 [Planctomycetota bacterium]